MAIEREFKFILNLGKAKELISDLTTLGFEKTHILQRYVCQGARVRKIIKGSTVSYVFTWKHKAAKSVIEIEQEISKFEFDTLSMETTTYLEKTRFKYFEPNTEIHWDIDFLLENGKIYFALAEAEVPPQFGDDTVIIPTFLAPYVVHSVPYAKNSKFVNRKLTNSNYAKLVYEGLNVK